MRTSLIAISVLAACNRPDLGVREPPHTFPTDVTHIGSTHTTSGTSHSTDGTSTDSSSTPSSSSSTPSSSSSTSWPSTSSTSSTTTTTGPDQYGIDVSHWEGSIDWTSVVNDGWSFAMTKATEGTYYTDSSFSTNYDGAFDAGMIRGAYHFAIPDDSDGATQADYFVDHGGGWSADGQTLPGQLDIEWNPYGSDCYGLSKSDMNQWIHDFDDEYYARTGATMMIYTAASWWAECVDSTDFSSYALWVAHYGVSSPNLPTGWSDYTIWQYDDSGSVAGVGSCDVNVYNGSWSQLYHYAINP